MATYRSEGEGWECFVVQRKHTFVAVVSSSPPPLVHSEAVVLTLRLICSYRERGYRPSFISAVEETERLSLAALAPEIQSISLSLDIEPYHPLGAIPLCLPFVLVVFCTYSTVYERDHRQSSVTLQNCMRACDESLSFADVGACC